MDEPTAHLRLSGVISITVIALVAMFTGHSEIAAGATIAVSAVVGAESWMVRGRSRTVKRTRESTTGPMHH